MIAVARRSLKKCPTSLKKYGFCGLLAVIYAAKIIMPVNRSQLQAFFAQVQRICSINPRKWEKLPLNKQGAISFQHTITLLQHYDACVFREVRPDPVKCKIQLGTWIRTHIAPRTSYIVHVKSHAFFLHVGSSKRKWTIYDQSGAKSRNDLSTLMKPGGYGRKMIARVLEITEK